MNERVERGIDKRPVLRPGVVLGSPRRLAGGLGERFGVQVSQMLGAAEHRSGAYSTYVQRGAQAATTQMTRMGAEDPSSIPRRPPQLVVEEMVEDAVELLRAFRLRGVAGAFYDGQTRVLDERVCPRRMRYRE